MVKCRFGLRALALAIFALTVVSMAEAQPKRTYVSVNGSDANVATQCQAAAPCRDFNAALSVVRSGGEVRALDAGGFGAATITKAVTLSGPSDDGAGIATSSGDAITVAAGQNDDVVIRGLTITGLGAPNAGNGIVATSFGNLHVESCLISGFLSIGMSGINVAVNANSRQVFIRDTILRDNWFGVMISTSTAKVTASIDHCRSENSVDGFIASSGAIVTVSNSVASGDFEGGFSTSALSAEMNCDSCVASNDGTGFIAQSGTMRVKGSTATGSFAGFSNSGGTFLSLGNNMIAGNQNDKLGTITILPPS